MQNKKNKNPQLPLQNIRDLWYIRTGVMEINIIIFYNLRPQYFNEVINH